MTAEIVLARIDNRLIHGQVLESWVPYLHADCLVVANDGVAAKPLQKKLMAAAVPTDLAVFIGSLAEVSAYVATLPRERRILLLFADTTDALRATEAGIRFSELNLGNLHGGEGKLRLSCTIAVDDQDLENCRKLEECGVRISARCIPTDESRDWRSLAGRGSL